MSLAILRSGTALNTEISRKLAGVLANDDPQQENVVAAALMRAVSNDNEGSEEPAAGRWERIRQGQESLSFSDLSAILQELHDQGFEINPAKMEGRQATPFAQQAFYDVLREAGEDGEQIKRQLQNIRDEAKAQKGFLSKAFNIFASEKPLEKVAEDVVEFELYCQKNGITFDDVRKQLVPGEKPKTAWDKINDYKFLIAAVGGTAVGVAGFDPAVYPVLNKVPGFFFTALPYFAVPFIGLNTFQAFSQRKLTEEGGTFLRFAGIMAAGVAIGFGAVGLMSGSLGTLDMNTTLEQAQQVAVRDGGAILNFLDSATGSVVGWAKQFSPGQILLPVIGASFGLSFLYKAARNKGIEAKNKLVNSFSRASVATGDFLGKCSGVLDKGFMKFINYAGAPAIFLLLSTTMAQGGFDKFSQYSGYYGTVGLALAGCATALAGAAYAYGLRGKQFKELARTFLTAFSLSSSSGTMPVTKKALDKIGVREKIRDSVVPLGATFNMMGTALYLGMTAVCASVMLGHDPTWAQKLGIMATSIATAFGAPGIPASSIAFMAPVLQQLDMTPEQMTAVFAMIMLMDRPFDMAQTALNVTGDMMVAVDEEASARGKGLKGIARRVFGNVPGLKGIFREKPASDKAEIKELPDKVTGTDAPGSNFDP